MMYDFALFAASTVPADGLALSSARPSAGAVMTKVRPHVCLGLVVQKI